MSAPAAAPPKPKDVEDAVDGLPPLDGDGGDEDRRAREAELLDDDEVPKDDGGDPFDDLTSEHDAADASDLASLDEEGASLLDAGEDPRLDVGGLEPIGSEGDRLTDQGDDEERAHEDYGLADHGSVAALDAGEEGPLADDESLTGEDLPELGDDLDDDAEDDASSFFDGDLSGASAASRARRAAVAWASPWERFGAPLVVPPVRALAAAWGGVLAGGRELVHVDLEGGTERLAARGLSGGDVTKIAVVEGEAFVTTETGGLFVSRDRGASFVELAAWREVVSPEEGAVGLDVVAGPRGALWGRTAKGSLLASRDRGATWARVTVDGFVRALTVDEGGQVVLFVRALGSNEVLRGGAPGAGWARFVVPGALVPHNLEGQASLVARAGWVAVVVDGEGVFRMAPGEAWRRVVGGERAASVALLDTDGALVLALAGPRGQLARVGRDGDAKVVAAWGDGEAQGRAEDDDAVVAVSVDDAHEVVWVGGAFGVAAFQPKMAR